MSSLARSSYRLELREVQWSTPKVPLFCKPNSTYPSRLRLEPWFLRVRMSTPRSGSGLATPRWMPPPCSSSGPAFRCLLFAGGVRREWSSGRLPMAGLPVNSNVFGGAGAGFVGPYNAISVGGNCFWSPAASLQLLGDRLKLGF